MQEIDSLQNCTERELREAKTYLEGDYLLELEDTQKHADQLLYWYDIGDVTLLRNYIHNIKKVSLADIRLVARKRFKYHALVELEGKGQKKKVKK